MSGTELLEDVWRTLAPAERAICSHRYLDALAAGRVPESSLRAFAGEQFSIIWSDRRSFAHLAGRFPEPPAGDFFLSLATGEGGSRLGGFAAAVGLGEEELRTYEPAPGAQAYKAFVAWLALDGSRAALALAFLANLDACGVNCGRMAEALRDRYGLGDEAVAEDI